MMFYCCVTLLITFVFIQAINLFSTLFNGFDEPGNDHNQTLPSIAVLVAARNEANNLPHCLDSLTSLDYPAHLIEIWVGNDQSDDNTEAVIDQYTRQFPQVKKLNITQTLGSAKGKANVLAQLAHQSEASIFLITDADIQVKPQWAKTMVLFLGDNIGIVSGTTVVNHTGYLSPMQQMDWLYFMGLLLNFNRFNIPSTAVGNNMAISRKAYFSTGGYEQLPFSVTEDYKLFKAVRQKGWKTINMLHPDAVNVSAPAPDFNTLMNQRKRWLTGAKELPLYWWVIFGIFGLFIPAIVLVFALNPLFAMALYAAKFCLQSLTLLVQQKQLNLKTTLLQLVIYEVYTIMLTLLTACYFLTPKKLNWKNRYY